MTKETSSVSTTGSHIAQSDTEDMGNLEEHIIWMDKALLEAQKAFDAGEVPVGAVVVQNGVQIGAGFNQPILRHDPSAHAEVIALRDAGAFAQNYRLPDSTLYVTIEPCTMCLGALIHARVSHVVFGATEPKAGVFASNPSVIDQEIYNHKLEWLGGVRELECAEIIQRFFKHRRAQKKALKQKS